MKKIKSLNKYSHITIWLIIAGVFWFGLAPRQIGGRYTYIIVTGNSMQPFLKNGDLAILQPGQSYQVGEVVLYRHPDLGPVIHRITAIYGGRYVMQGDHNEWSDSYQPTRTEVDGKLWLHVPGMGKVIQVFRTPLGAAILAGFLGALIFWPDRSRQVKPGPAS